MTIDDDLSCLCGKRFARSSAASNHRRSCTKTKSRVSSLLENARKVWAMKKAKRAQVSSNETLPKQPTVVEGASAPGPSDLVAVSSDLTTSSGRDAGETERMHQPDPRGCNMGSNVPLALGRTPRKKQPNSKYRRDYESHSAYNSSPERMPSPAQGPASPTNTVDDGGSEEIEIDELGSNVLEVDEQSFEEMEVDGQGSDGREADGQGSEKMEVDSQPTLSQIVNSDRSLCTAPNKFGLFRKFISDPCATSSPTTEEELGFYDDQSPYPAFRAHSQAQAETRPDSPPEGRGHPVPYNTLTNSELATGNTQACSSTSISFAPYPNISSFLLGEWFWNGGTQKSQRDFENLMRILKSQEFNLDDIQRTNWTSVNAKLGSCNTEEGGPVPDQANGRSDWIQKDVQIRVPFHSHQITNGMGPGAKPFVVGQLRYRSIISIIRDRLTRPGSSDFHLDPYELYWSPREGEPAQRVYGELYSSPAFVKAHRDLQAQIRDDNCTLPRVVVGLMFASDETHLTQFGDTKLWPLYMWLGNESKYRRGKPSEHLCQHVAYFTKLPDTFKEFVSSHIGKKKVNPNLITHCIRELLHAQWEIILDDEFVDAYKNGIVLRYFDGVLRRFFPRIFTYSADYREKVVIAGIRSLPAKCPCPRCLAELANFGNMGTFADRHSREENKRTPDVNYNTLVKFARHKLYEGLYAVDGDHVDGLLKGESLAPIQNAFFSRLTDPSLDFFSMLVVDLMHEIESGNWKSLFIHLLRIIHCSDDHSLVHQINGRYREVPTFGGDTIRKFQKNVTEMKNLAARDWEDMLQCAIPVFDGLFDEPHNSAITQLLHTLAYWHGMAKLRLHTDASLALLDSLTTRLGHSFRYFKLKTCAAFNTKELPREADARYRRNNKAAGNASANTANKAGGALNLKGKSKVQENAKHSELPTPGSDANLRKIKQFNINTYKFHAFGDYVATIKTFGTTDSYSTEPGELEHRSSKNRYQRTSKKDYTTQMAQIERRQDRIREIRTALDSNYAGAAAPSNGRQPNAHYRIGSSENTPIYLFDFLNKNQGDPAIKGFLGRLKNHIFPRVKQSFNIHTETPDTSFCFHREKMFQHQTLRISYTTYDLRDAEDVINPNTSHCDIMLLRDADGNSSPEQINQHPFLYGRVLGIFHVNVICTEPGTDPTPHRVDFVWVRWFEHRFSREIGQLDQLRFRPLKCEDAFGFIDPCNILRGCHIIPHFKEGKRQSDEVEEPSDAFWEPRQKAKLRIQPLTAKKQGSGLSGLAHDGDDWKVYCINPFVDRDMLMRYHWGMAIGHTYCYQSPHRRALSCGLYKEESLDLQMSTSECSSSFQNPDIAPEQLCEEVVDVLVDAEPVLRGNHYEIRDPHDDFFEGDEFDTERAIFGADMREDARNREEGYESENY